MKNFITALLLFFIANAQGQGINNNANDEFTKPFIKGDRALFIGMGPKGASKYTAHVPEIITNTHYLLDPKASEYFSLDGIYWHRKRFSLHANIYYSSADVDSSNIDVVGFSSTGISMVYGLSIKKHRLNSRFNLTPQIGFYANSDHIFGYQSKYKKNVITQSKIVDTWRTINAGYLYSINIMKSFKTNSMFSLLRFHLEMGHQQKFNNQYSYFHKDASSYCTSIETEKKPLLNYYQFTFHFVIPARSHFGTKEKARPSL